MNGDGLDTPLTARGRPVRIVDATRPMYAGMPVWPGDVPCRHRATSRIADAGYNGSELCLSAHTGTHADGAYHVFDDGARIGDAPLDAFLGSAHVVDVDVDAIDAAWLRAALTERCERLLLRTRAWADPRTFPARWPALTADGARYLVERGIRLVGTDAPSPDPVESTELPAHKALLGAGAGILENVLLDDAEPGEWELIALPLRLVEGDGSPVRAVLVRR